MAVGGWFTSVQDCFNESQIEQLAEWGLVPRDLWFWQPASNCQCVIVFIFKLFPRRKQKPDVFSVPLYCLHDDNKRAHTCRTEKGHHVHLLKKCLSLHSFSLIILTLMNHKHQWNYFFFPSDWTDVIHFECVLEISFYPGNHRRRTSICAFKWFFFCCCFWRG